MAGAEEGKGRSHGEPLLPQTSFGGKWGAKSRGFCRAAAFAAVP